MSDGRDPSEIVADMLREWGLGMGDPDFEVRQDEIGDWLDLMGDHIDAELVKSLEHLTAGLQKMYFSDAMIARAFIEAAHRLLTRSKITVRSFRFGGCTISFGTGRPTGLPPSVRQKLTEQ